MAMRLCLSLIFLWAICFPAVWAADELIRHDLKVELDPFNHRLKVSDQIILPEKLPSEPVFCLHRGLQPRTSSPGVKILPVSQQKPGLCEKFKLILPPGIRRFSVEYEGSIYHPLEGYGKEQARGFRNTPGLIADVGVYLAGGSYWYPEFDSKARLVFNLAVSLPAGWKSVSQGEYFPGEKYASWKSLQPQEEIYLIAAPFTEYMRKSGRSTAMVFLREPDQALANKYLDATNRYLAMYEALLGAYPYNKFALVENFWETGFGMPSFTLLGSRVIRLPFILNSSYPHEILHNWWGNGVYVDYQSGNWSEGLTAYLADHLIKEQQGQGAAYRQQSLQKYADYAARSRDFPLVEFRGRHSSASEAVGYGKTLMFFHMLRRELGDDSFRNGLRIFYQRFKFQKASYDDLRKVFEEIAGKSLTAEFSQWTERTGAPALRLSNTRKTKSADGYRLSFHLEQTQAGDAYQLRIPLAVTMQGRKQALQTDIKMKQKQQSYEIDLPARPLRIDIDPEFDLFRKLAREETPAAFSELFGSSQMLVVLPAGAAPGLLKAYQAFAADMQKMGPDRVSVKLDSELDSLPADKGVALLGWNNRFYADFFTLLGNDATGFERGAVRIAGKTLPESDLSLALITRRSDSAKNPIGFISTELPEALPGLGRKLPHYHKYSYLAFVGTEPQNQLKGRWPVTRSPMTALLDGSAGSGELVKRKALAEAPVEFDADRMMETIRFLSSDELQGRGFGDAGLDRAADYIAQQFEKAGLVAGGDGAGDYFQVWREKAGEPPREALLKNIIGVIPAANPDKAKNIVIGAHYDHLGLGWPDVRAHNQGQIHYGADDNASGIAVLLELARTLAKKTKPDHNIVFIAFSAEEAGRLGSRQYIKHLGAQKTLGMINLDTVGRLGDKQLLVLGASSAREWPHIFRGIAYITGIPITNVTQDLDSSDHISFQEAGIPAVQLFSGANQDYHRPSDSADKIDTQGLVKVATVAKEALEYLSSKGASLTASPRIGGAMKNGPKKQRKVSLGGIPDFSYGGQGYRVSAVTPESPAAACGLKKGDIITQIGAKKIQGMKDVSNILKILQPGDKTSVVYLRGEKEITCETILEAK